MVSVNIDVVFNWRNSTQLYISRVIGKVAAPALWQSTMMYYLRTRQA